MSVLGTPEYKETEVGLIPTDWQARKLGDLVTKVGSGVTPKGGSESYLTSGVPLIRSQNVLWGKLHLLDVVYISDDQHERMANSALQPLDVLLNITGASIGRCAVLPSNFGEGNVNQHVCIIRPANLLQPSFLSHYLNSQFGQGQISKLQAGGNREGLNFQQTRGFSIALPPLPEQQKISAIFAAVDDKLQVIARQISTTQTLKQGLMQTLFSKGVGTQNASGRWVLHTEFEDSELGEIPAGWRADKLNMHVTKVGSGVTPKGGSDAYLNSGVPLIRSQNVLVGQLSLDDVVFISDEQHAKMSNSALVPKDVLLNITGASIGRCAILPADFVEGNVNQHVCIIRPQPTLNPYFLCHYLNSDAGQKQVNKFQAGGNREGLNYQQIRSFDLPLPSASEQQKIAEVLDSVDTKLEALSTKQTHYQTLKRGLMQKLLTGEWRVKVETLAEAATP